MSKLRRTKLVAIKNFDEELYRLIKTYASLEGKTVASITEEAVRFWISSKNNYNEVLTWTMLEKEYVENFNVLKKEIKTLSNKYNEGYVLICDKHVVGVFKSYNEAAKKSKEICSKHALIVKLPYEEKQS